jgi:hypothetical protein
MAFSAMLLSASSRPSVTERVNASRRLIVSRNASARADLADSLTSVAFAQSKKASSSEAVSLRCSTRSAAGANRAFSSIK